LELAKKNAHVIIASRTPSKGQAAVDEIKAETKNEKVEFMQLDLLTLASVTNFVNEFKAKNLQLHLLLNNAGVMSCPFALSEDGYESQFATNHVSSEHKREKRDVTGTVILNTFYCNYLIKSQLAPFYLTTQLLPILEQSQPSRIVNVSSMAHKAIYFHGLSLDKLNDKSKYNEHIAYGRSKTCNILFTRELSDRLEKKGVKVCKNEDSALV
jgi:NAD(P)-dependent dehydrogenase (short-subunit alcohol dehydrogenase family)